MTQYYKVCEGSGLDSGRIGRIITGEGRLFNALELDYVDSIDLEREEILEDLNGEVFPMFKNRLVPINIESEITRTPVEECPAGPDIDAACALALGWKVNKCEGGSLESFDLPSGEVIPAGDFMPSINPTDTKIIFEAIKQLCSITIGYPYGEYFWYVTFAPFSDHWQGRNYETQYAKTLELAACRAFLKYKRQRYVEYHGGTRED